MEILGTLLKETAEVAKTAVEAGMNVAETAKEVATPAISESIPNALSEVAGNSDNLTVTNQQIDNLLVKAAGIERSPIKNEIAFKGVKICATRHGCTGATNCDCAYGAPVGR